MVSTFRTTPNDLLNRKFIIHYVVIFKKNMLSRICLKNVDMLKDKGKVFFWPYKDFTDMGHPLGFGKLFRAYILHLTLYRNLHV